MSQINIPSSSEEIRDQWLKNYKVGMIIAGVDNPAIEPGSEPYIRATANANIALTLFAQIQLAANDSSELTAEGDALDDIREATGLPEILARPAAGELVASIVGTASVTFVDGLEFQLENGLRGQVNGTQIGIQNGDLVQVIMIDSGSASNADAGDEVTWLNPPLYVNTTAQVGPDGLIGGTDEETDNEKRERILDRRRQVPAGGNWGYLVELAENSTDVVQKAFVYPTLGGPGSVKVVVTKSQNASTGDWSRIVPDSSLSLVRTAIFSNMPVPYEIIIESITEEDSDVSLSMELSDVNGFENFDQPYPSISGSTFNQVKVATKTSSSQITVDHSNTPARLGDRIMWWSPTTKEFVKATVTANQTLVTDQLTLDRPLVDSEGTEVAVGDYISPAIVNGTDMAITFLQQMNNLGPAENENTTTYPRAARRPAIQTEFYTELTSRQISPLEDNFEEIISVEYTTTPAAPTVAASVSDSPNVLVLNHFGIYEK